MRRALLVAALLAGCLVPPAGAHEEMALHHLTVLDSVSPALDGVEVRIVHLGAPAFAVHNPTGIPVTVLDEKGRPFLEIGPTGVRADVSSRLFYDSVVPGSHDRLRPSSRGPRWVTFSDDPRWTWFDPRLETTDATESWTVPVRYGATPATLSGGFEPLEHHGHFVSELDEPGLEGLDVRLVQGPVPVMYVRNDRREVLEVMGAADEPFLRVGPGGVFANVMSPSYYSAGALTIKRVPPWADATAPPRWERISDQPLWAWLEYRAAVSPEMQQRDRLGSASQTVHTWTSPLTLAGEALDLQGSVRWVPPGGGGHVASDPNDDGLPRSALAIAVAIAALVALFVLMRRPRASIA